MDSLLGVDWREAWRGRDERRPEAGNSAYWDERSKDFKSHSGLSKYTDIFLDYLKLAPGESVLDMGAGPGTIALPLAEAGHSVIAADFSAGMRQAAEERARERGLSSKLKVMKLDWNEDWEAQGIKQKSVDVAVASRSTMVKDLADALAKLDRTARRKVALTMTTEYGPKGFKARGSKEDECDEGYVADYIYCLNILLQRGAYPELRYIDTTHGNGGEREGQLVRWAFIAWKPVSTSSEELYWQEK